MDNWDRINMTTPPDEAPEEPVMEFLKHRFGNVKTEMVFLDIGPGRAGRHCKAIEQMGYTTVIAVDVSHACRANFHGNIRDFNFLPDSLDCVLDIKTLCQDPDPPYGKIHGWIKPGGYLFAMLPTSEHLVNKNAYDIKNHEDYTYEYVRFATYKEAGELFSMFRKVHIQKYVKTFLWQRQRRSLFSWCVEAQK